MERSQRASVAPSARSPFSEPGSSAASQRCAVRSQLRAWATPTGWGARRLGAPSPPFVRRFSTTLAGPATGSDLRAQHARSRAPVLVRRFSTASYASTSRTEFTPIMPCAPICIRRRDSREGQVAGARVGERDRERLSFDGRTLRCPFASGIVPAALRVRLTLRATQHRPFDQSPPGKAQASP